MAVVRGLFGTGNLEAGIKKLDVRDMIFELQPDEAPFVTVLQKVSKLKAVDTKFTWFEDDMIGAYTQVAGTQALGVLTLIVDDTSGMSVNDVWQNTTSRECILIKAINSSTSITVLRGWGVTGAAEMTDNHYLYRLGNAQQEGWTAPEALVTAKVPKDNYLQIFSKTVQITTTADKIATYGGNRRDFERNKKGRELKIDIESQFLFGEPKLDTTGAQPRWQTAGVYYIIKGTAPELDMNNAALTESAFEGFLKDLFTYGSSTKLMFCGPLILSQISGFALGKQRIEAGTTGKYGFKITTYHSANGDVDLVKDQHFIGPYAGMGIVLDIDELTYRYLDGMDITLMTNIQEKKDHYLMDEYSGQIGLELHHAKKHGLLLRVA